MVEAPYKDGAEKTIAEKYGKSLWSKFEAEHGKITLVRLHNSVSPAALQRLIEQAVELDETYRPHNFFSWYTIDCPDGLHSEEFAATLRQWEIVETAYPDEVPVDPSVNPPGNNPDSGQQGYLNDAPEGIGVRSLWNPPGVDGVDGADQHVIDLERNWNLNHEDLIRHSPDSGDIP